MLSWCCPLSVTSCPFISFISVSSCFQLFPLSSLGSLWCRFKKWIELENLSCFPENQQIFFLFSSRTWSVFSFAPLSFSSSLFLLKQLIASEQHIYLMMLKGTEKKGRHEKKQLFGEKKETNWKHWDPFSKNPSSCLSIFTHMTSSSFQDRNYASFFSDS